MSPYRTILTAIMVSTLICISGQAIGQNADFYKGKTIKLIVPNSAGGKMTRYARMIAPYIAKHANAQDVRISNMPGAGGLLGSNALWHAKPDGMTIAFTSIPSLILANLAGSKGAQFDATKFVYLGRAATEPRVLTVGAHSKIKTIQDVENLKRPFVFPTQGTDEDFYTMAVLADVLNFKLKIITGYKGNPDTNLAVIKGDGDGHITGWTAVLPTIEAGELRPILTISSKRFSAYPDVPTALEVVHGKEKKATIQAIVNMLEVHRSFFGPPNMDPEATKVLRKAIESALTDPKLQAEAKKRNLLVEPMNGATEQKLVTQIADASGSIKPILKAALKSIQ